MNGVVKLDPRRPSDSSSSGENEDNLVSGDPFGENWSLGIELGLLIIRDDPWGIIVKNQCSTR